MDLLLRDFWAMIPITGVALPFALFGWRVLAAWRRRRRPARTATVTAGMDAAIALLGVLVFCLVALPMPGHAATRLHLVPGADVLTAFGEQGSLWQIGGNLVLLCPFGALLPVRTTALRSVTRVAVAAFAVSAMIEIGQYLIHAGRVTSTDDVLLNTIGAAAGAGLTRGWWRVAVVTIPVQMRRNPVPSDPVPAGTPGVRPDGAGAFRGELAAAEIREALGLLGDSGRPWYQLVRECP